MMHESCAPYLQLYHSRIYYESKCSETKLDHGVLAVGYSSEGDYDYWLVKNRYAGRQLYMLGFYCSFCSWGEKWGQKDYIMMSRNRHNNCGIATQASYPIV